MMVKTLVSITFRHMHQSRQTCSGLNLMVSQTGASSTSTKAFFVGSNELLASLQKLLCYESLLDYDVPTSSPKSLS
jgi:hypothetical protein